MEFYDDYILRSEEIPPIFWYKDGVPKYKENIESNSIYYKLNSSGLRCDELIKNNKDGKHILFSGCSITAGIGVNKEDTWAYKMYEDFSNTSGFFNIALPGASIIEIVVNVLKYCELYGIPDNIFLLLPPVYRDDRYIKKEFIDTFVYNNYLILERYCKSNKIKLLSTSWADKENYGTLSQFQTFFIANIEDVEYHGDQILGDDNNHPGPSIHSFWHNEFKKKYALTYGLGDM